MDYLLNVEELLDITGRLLLAVVLGGAVAFSRRVDSYRLSMIQTHAFLAVATAMLMMIIEGQIVRAVGLLGVASVIRYRYAMRSAVDASTLIIALGIGMACGSGLYAVAILGTVFIVVIGFWFRSLHLVLPKSLLRHSETAALHIETTDYQRSLERLKAVTADLGVTFGVRSLQRKLTGKRGATVEVIFSVTYDPSLDLTQFPERLLDEHTFRASWRDIDRNVR